MTENIEHYRNQIALARTEIKNLRQQISSLKHEHLNEIKQIKSQLSGLETGGNSGIVSTTTNHAPQPSSPSTSSDLIKYKPIGLIETTFQNKRGVPRQTSVMSKAKGVVVVDPSVFSNPEHALSGLEEFSHMWIIFHFHTTESNHVPAKVAPPRLGGDRRGVFSTRSPHRPCPIGLSLVKIHSIEGNRIHFLGVDMVNGTPVLDIKPYIPQYDYPMLPGANSERPPTEGINNVVDSVAGLQMPGDSPNQDPLIDNHPRLPFQVMPTQSINSISPLDSPSSEELDGMQARDERGAPDGQERFTPPQSAIANMTRDGIRIAPWVANPPTQVYEVRFTDDVNIRLAELLGERAAGFKSNIQSLLSEDPRSNYVRNRYPDHEYSCVLEDLSISCIFDSSSSICTIVAVRNAEDMQS